MASNFNLADYGINQASNVEVQDALSDYVRERFREAADHKRNTGIEEILLRNLRANKCQYQPDEVGLLGPYNDVYIGICALKARAAESWITDIVLNNIDKPWTISPTPEPDLPEEEKERVVDTLLAEISSIQSVEQLKERAQHLKSAFTKEMHEEAEYATARMEKRIEDQLAEGNWVKEFGKVIADVTAFPAAIMRGPISISKTKGAWKNNKYSAQRYQTPDVRAISPFDAYPAPNASDTQDGEYFIERTRFSVSSLMNLAKTAGFNAGNVRQAIDAYPNGYKQDLMGDAERRELEEKGQDIASLSGVVCNEVETLIYNGKVPGKLLVEHGVIVPDIQDSYECEVWVAGIYVIKAVINPNPTGARPIERTCFRHIPGQFWGQSVICLTYDTGRICNASARNLVRNMGFSAGPIGEVVAERVEGTQDPTDITPYRVVLVGPDLSGTGAPAYKFHNVQSVANELKGITEYYMKIADDLSGVPSYVLGNPQVAGAGRTLGGLSMLMGNAAKGIKMVILNIDRNIITGIITGFYIYNMVTSEDDSIKADCMVVARGATGLLQRELAQTRTVEILQLLTPYIEQWDSLPAGIKIMLREIMKTTGLPVDDIIPDPNAQEGITNLTSLLGLPPGTGSPTPAPNMQEPMMRGMQDAPALPPQSLPPVQPNAGPTVPINLAQGA